MSSSQMGLPTTNAQVFSRTLLPQVETCGSLRLAANSLVVAAAGFEDRTMAFASRLVGVGRGAGAIVVEYTPGEDNNRKSALIAELGRRGIRIYEGQDVLRFDRFRPDGFSYMLDAMVATRRPRAIWIDISSMSKMLLLLCLEVARQHDLETNVFYAEAEAYAPSESDYKSAKASGMLHKPTIEIYSGVGEVVRASRLSSVSMQGEPLAAVMFMSFNELLTQALISTVYPSRLFLINGRPPEHSWREEAMAWIHSQLLCEWPELDNPVLDVGEIKLPARSTSTLDYRETAAEILNLYAELAAEYRMVMAPTGSKMQAVGAYLARAIHPDIHVEYPTPKGYLRLFSAGVGKCWVIRFGNLGELIRGCQRLERSRLFGISPLGSSSNGLHDDSLRV